jgi:hypothetical protein
MAITITRPARPKVKASKPKRGSPGRAGKGVKKVKTTTVVSR